MIPARKSAFFSAWLARDAAKRIRRTFGMFSIAGEQRVRDALASGAVLVVSNHSTWWDPIVVQVLCRRLEADAFALMDAKNLRRLPFFARIGAFGVDLDDPADGARGVRHAVKLLGERGRLVWIFPQGREAPLEQRPLGFLPGTEAIARLAKRAVVVPCALHYSFGSETAPELRVVFGEPIEGAHERAVTELLDSIRAVPGEMVVRRAPSWLFRIAERCLAFFAR